jgi:DNA-binding NtrC family response regulator
VRIIAASNADLRELIEDGRFREDLYFRLKVLTLHTPALRDHRQNIEILARHYLSDIGRRRDIPALALSRGALEKLRDYHWPGNVRELEHCLLRAAVMADRSVIQADDLQLDGVAESSPEAASNSKTPDPSPADSTMPMVAAGSAKRAQAAVPLHLNPRQRKALPVICAKGEIGRGEYQESAGDVPPRTAVHDLNDLVQKGVLERVGRGPATRYIWTGRWSPADFVERGDM